MRLATLTAILTLALAGTAQATVIDLPANSSKPYRKWTREAKVPTPPGLLEVNLDVNTCGTYVPASAIGGCARLSDGVIVVRPRAGRRVWFHELGHFEDAYVLTDIQRAEFARLVNRPGGVWNGEPGLNEVFAELYAQCAVGIPSQRALRRRWWPLWIKLKRYQAKTGCSMIRELG